MAFAYEREEWRAALRGVAAASCPPGHHHMTANRHGGGTCIHCGDTIGGDEL